MNTDASDRAAPPPEPETVVRVDSRRIVEPSEGGMSERAQLTRADGSAMRMLIVEDEDTRSQLLSMAFKYEGWDVRIAASGPDAVRAAREYRPDVAMLDVMLPGFDGLEVLERMRADD